MNKDREQEILDLYDRTVKNIPGPLILTLLVYLKNPKSRAVLHRILIRNKNKDADSAEIRPRVAAELLNSFTGLGAELKKEDLINDKAQELLIKALEKQLSHLVESLDKDTLDFIQTLPLPR